MSNTLYYGDNLAVLREDWVKDGSVDLIYLDPPFNSDATYNILFKKPTGEASEAQAEAFLDTWTWGPAAATAYGQIIEDGGKVAPIMAALYSAFGKSDMMAYLVMMGARLEELARKLKSTGSIYLHCDPTASHYLKIILDAIFGPMNFRSEVIWKRTSSHNSAKRWGPIHDTILFLSKSDSYTWNRVFTDYDENYVRRYYRFQDTNGRRYRLSDLTGSGVRHGESGESWNGFNPTAHGRHWAIPSVVKEEFPGQEDNLRSHGWLDLFDSEGLVEMTGDGVGWPHVRRYFDRMAGQVIQDIVTDIPPLSRRHAERIGYPTQKPLALLKRILLASSNEGDVVLDPFCGCGTTVEAAEALGRQWIGIDVTHYAISLVEARLKKHFPSATLSVDGRPDSYAAARDLARRSKYQFQWWANWLLQVQDYRERKKGPDGGIDGTIYFPNGPREIGRVIVSAKAGENLHVNMVRELLGTITIEEAEMGVLVTLNEPTSQMFKEARQSGIVKTAHGTFPKVQLLWIKEWFDGKRPELPRAFEPQKLRAFAKPAREEGQLDFTFSIPGGKPARKDEKVFTDPRVALAD